jgi:hypothetical protein
MQGAVREFRILRNLAQAGARIAKLGKSLQRRFGQFGAASRELDRLGASNTDGGRRCL